MGTEASLAVLKLEVLTHSRGGPVVELKTVIRKSPGY